MITHQQKEQRLPDKETGMKGYPFLLAVNTSQLVPVLDRIVFENGEGGDGSPQLL